MLPACRHKGRRQKPAWAFSPLRLRGQRGHRQCQIVQAPKHDLRPLTQASPHRCQKNPCLVRGAPRPQTRHHLCQKTGPPPFANLPRFHGFFAPRAKLRERVVAQVNARTSSPPAKCQARQPTSSLNDGSILDVLPKRKHKKDKRYRLD